MTALSQTTGVAELEVVFDTLEDLFVEALAVVRGAERERLSTVIDRALGALQRVRHQDDSLGSGGLDSFSLAEDAVRNVASILRRSRSEAAPALAARVDGLCNAMRDARNEALEAIAVGAPREEPTSFSASRGVPSSHVLTKRPGRRVKPAGPLAQAENIGLLIASLQSSIFSLGRRLAVEGEAALDELESMSELFGEDEDAPVVESPLVRLREPAATEDTRGRRGQEAMLRRIARSLLEEVATAGLLRSPREHETVGPQVRRFEARLLAALDALAALGSEGRITIDVVEQIVGWAADAPATDVFRAFTRSFLLASLRAEGAAEAAVLGMRTSPPRTWPAQTQGFILGSNREVSESLRRALPRSSGKLASHLLDALRARGEVRLGDVVSSLGHAEAALREEAVRALAACPERDEARRLLEGVVERELEPSVVVAAIESLAIVDLKAARRILRERIDDEAKREGALSHDERRALLVVLAIVGEEADAERLALAVAKNPRDAEAIGWHGSVASIEPLLECLRHPREAVRKAAARSLHRITGAELAEVDDDEHLRDPDPYRPVVSEQRWRSFWHEHRDEYQRGLRYRLGRPFHLTTTIDEIVGLVLPARIRRLALYELAVGAHRRLPDHRTWVFEIETALGGLRDEVASFPSGAWLKPSPSGVDRR